MGRILTFHMPDAIPSGTVFANGARRKKVVVPVQPKRHRRRPTKAASASDAAEARLLARTRAVLETCFPNLAFTARLESGRHVPADGQVRVHLALPAFARPTAIAACRKLREFHLDAHVEAGDDGFVLLVTDAADNYEPWHRRIIDGKPFA